jgi:uncharacterized protein (TIGR03663 family)
MSTRVFWCLFALALVVGLALRLYRLDARPMHHDEANQAVKFGLLLESGQYGYDSADHHGPTLYYLTLPAAWLRGQQSLAALDERTVRVVPALFGGATIVLFALLARGMGRGAVAAAALLAAISPALTYYSRFYIQEALLVFFALSFLVAIGRYALEPRLAPAATAGVCAGLALATKETSILLLPAALIACGSARRIAFRASAPWRPPSRPPFRVTQLVGAVAAAIVVAGTLYSSFFTHPAGVLDAVRAFSGYIDKGLQPRAHVEPWYYYLRLLSWSADGGLRWSEALILLLALIGAGSAFAALGTQHSAPSTRHPAPGTRHLFWPLYLTLYSLLTCVVFSAIRYKTPWNLLPFYVGFVLLAGRGAATALGSGPWASGVAGAHDPKHPSHTRVVRVALGVVLVVAAAQLATQDWRANFRYAADARNPYAYVHTVPDFLRLVRRVQDLAAMHGEGSKMLVKVVAGAYEQWPLPWYLRRMERVGYWTSASAAAPFDGAPVVIASAENSAALDAALGDRYVSEFYGLRPNVLLAMYIERGLWERFLASR